MPDTITVAPDLAQMVDDALRRVALLEQRITSPSYVVPNGSTPTFPTVNIGQWDGIGTYTSLGVSSASSSPTGLSLSSGSVFEDIYIDASWTAPVAGTAVEYEVQIAKKVSGVYSIISAQRTLGTSVRIHRLDPNSTYGIRVYAVNRIGVLSTPLPASGYTDQATTVDATIPAQVTGLVATAGMSSVLLTWTDNTEQDVVKGQGLYRLQYATDSGFTANVVTRLVSGTLASVVGLTAGTTYYFHVLAIDSSGNEGSYSSTASATPGTPAPVFSDGSAPGSSPAPTVVGGATFLFVKWTAVTNADTVTYEVHMSTTSGFTPSAGTKVAETDATNVIVKTDVSGAALVYGTTYYFKIIAKDRDGSAAASAQGSGTMSKLTGDTDLVAGSITVASGVIGSLDANIISTGTLAAGRIGAGSIDSSRLTVSSMSEDMLPNGNFEDLDPAGAISSWTAVNNTLTSYTTAPLQGTRSASLALLSGTTMSITSRPIPVTAGETYYLAAMYKMLSGTAMGFQIDLDYYNTAGAFITTLTPFGPGGPTVTATTGEGQTIAPANAKTAIVRLLYTGLSAGAVALVDAARMQRVVSQVRIADGAITADKIMAGQITSDKISVIGLDAGVITYGVMLGDRIQANTLDAGVIKSSSITSSTITLSGSGAFKVGGPGLTGQYGMLIDAQGVRIYDNTGSGVPVIYLNATNGSGTFKGDISGSTGTFVGTLSGGAVIGGTVTGAIIQTSATTTIDRVQVDSAGVTVQREGTTNVLNSASLILTTDWTRTTPTGWTANLNLNLSASDAAAVGMYDYTYGKYWRFDGAGAESGAATMYQDYTATLTPGDYWTASIWARRGVATHGISIRIDWYTAAGAFISSTTSGSYTASTTWQRITTTGQVPATAGKIRVIVTFAVGSGAVGLYVTAAQLENKDHATLYSDQWQPDSSPTTTATFGAPSTRATGNILQALVSRPDTNRFVGSVVGSLATGQTYHRRIEMIRDSLSFISDEIVGRTAVYQHAGIYVQGSTDDSTHQPYVSAWSFEGTWVTSSLAPGRMVLNSDGSINFYLRSSTTPMSVNGGYIGAYPAAGSGSKALDFNESYSIYVDNVGSGTAASRWWLDAPSEGEVVIGPRAGGSLLNRIRLRTDTLLLGADMPTVANAANVWFRTTDFEFFRSTSSLRYKEDIRPIAEPQWGLLDLTPFRYKGSGELARDGVSRDFIGLAAEDFDALGLHELVDYEEDSGLPDWLMYERIGPLLLPMIKDLKKRIEVLESV